MSLSQELSPEPPGSVTLSAFLPEDLTETSPRLSLINAPRFYAPRYLTLSALLLAILVVFIGTLGLSTSWTSWIYIPSFVSAFYAALQAINEDTLKEKFLFGKVNRLQLLYSTLNLLEMIFMVLKLFLLKFWAFADLSLNLGLSLSERGKRIGTLSGLWTLLIQ